MQRLAPLAACLVLAAPACRAQSLTEVWRLDGFATPESAFYNPANGEIIVSNIGNFAPDGGEDGTLSRVSADGALLEADWVTGLVDPKGMAASDGTLYVVDVTGLLVIDLETGTLEDTIALPGAEFPNDVTIADDGTIYVSDFTGQRIYKVTDGTAELWMEPGSLPLPNGIWAHGDALIVGSFGDVLNPDFSVNTPGGLLAIDFSTRAVTAVGGTEGTASVDGIVAVGDALVYDDYPTGRLFRWADGTSSAIGTAGTGTTDLGVMGDVLLVPNLETGVLTAFRVAD